MLHLSFETLAMQQKIFGNFMENVMIIPCKGVIQKCQPVNYKLNTFQVLKLPVDQCASQSVCSL